ncbi:MAG: leucine-rich repeat domain-containing protein [Clostridia bacterium]|nr:leucine-rich repeat domain-containing protein [Clostridia bacterium]
MKIYVTGSEGALRARAEEALEKLNCTALEESARTLKSADALLVVLTENGRRRIKEDLNLALDAGLPVAVIRPPESATDRGLEIQLDLAFDVSETDPEPDLARWIDALKKKRARNLKKRITAAILITAAIAVLAAAAAILFPKLFDKPKVPASTGTVTADPFEGADPESLTVLDLSGKGLSDISFLSAAINLTELDLGDNEITDVSPLAKLTKLARLNLKNNRINDVNVLLSLKDLRELDLRGNPLTDRTVLDFMTDVNVLTDD